MLKRIIFICSLIVILLTITVLTSYGNKEIAYTKVKIENGQTLWNIATRFNNNEDPRKLVYQIKQVNDLQNSILTPGQIIKVPVSPAKNS